MRADDWVCEEVNMNWEVAKMCERWLDNKIDEISDVDEEGYE